MDRTTLDYMYTLFCDRRRAASMYSGRDTLTRVSQFIPCEVRFVPDRERVVTFRASTAAKDRHGSRVMPMGIDTTHYDKNPIFLWAHDGYGSFFGGGPSIENVIGRVVATRKSESAFDIDVEFAKGDVNERAEMAFKLVKAGFLNTVSIGFIPKKSHTETVGEEETEIHDEVELLEVSLVPIPSNRDAVAIARSMLRFSSPRTTTPEPTPAKEEVAALVRHMGNDAIQGATDIAEAMIRIGRVLSSANEARLRQAKDLLDEILIQLAKQAQDEEQDTKGALVLTVRVYNRVGDTAPYVVATDHGAEIKPDARLSAMQQVRVLITAQEAILDKQLHPVTGADTAAVTEAVRKAINTSRQADAIKSAVQKGLTNG